MNFIAADWPAPDSIRAAVTLRTGGISRGPYASWNLADHVGDDPDCVARNRQILRERLALPSEPVWLRQVHGNRVIRVDREEGDKAEDICIPLSPTLSPNGGEGTVGGKLTASPERLSPDTLSPAADAAFTSRPNLVLAVLTADCLPILLTDGTACAAVHAGWRGLLAGIVDNALAVPPWRHPPMAWLGPAIGPEAFEVGAEVKDAFLNRNPDFAAAFRPAGETNRNLGRRSITYLADLYLLARLILQSHGVEAVYGGRFCTHGDRQRFYSYRRDGVCGRMASLIWRA
ncbi:peptidoglycan editing factor PgeF [Methylohalobius crimeensis]|uniref:peptidoglycan editing factor PgeF n=1 Tax=Methylohalobius crimeensis TaxID=244365 RepID=UPI0003B3C81A|nr:peptidoglycan editing factor PgeF [Methylohalobius crimeensis]